MAESVQWACAVGWEAADIVAYRSFVWFRARIPGTYFPLPPLPEKMSSDGKGSSHAGTGGAYAHVSSGVNSQGNSYTSYAGGGYSYNNAPSAHAPSGGSYFTPRASSAASGSGFYTARGGSSGGGYSFYQNSSGGRSYK